MCIITKLLDKLFLEFYNMIKTVKMCQVVFKIPKKEILCHRLKAQKVKLKMNFSIGVAFGKKKCRFFKFYVKTMRTL